jgi:hypothetical protein
MGLEVLTEPCFVRTDSGTVSLHKGAAVPEDADQASVGRLVQFGVIGESGEPRPPVMADVLAEVGDDPGLALIALKEEQARPRPRKTLVEKLQAIANAPDDQV